jgi:hypothetical protein
LLLTWQAVTWARLYFQKIVAPARPTPPFSSPIHPGAENQERKKKKKKVTELIGLEELSHNRE